MKKTLKSKIAAKKLAEVPAGPLKGTLTEDQKGNVMNLVGNLKRWSTEKMRSERNLLEARTEIQLRQVQIQKYQEIIALQEQSVSSATAMLEQFSGSLTKLKEEVCATHGVPAQDFEYDDKSPSLEITFMGTDPQ